MCSPCMYVCWFVVVEGPNLSMKRVICVADIWAVFKPCKDPRGPNGFDLSHPRAEICQQMCFLLLGMPQRGP